MTCQDCIHHNVCYYAGRLKTKDSDGEKRIIAETNNVEDTCKDFSDRSAWEKLPCRVGDAVWVVYTPKYPANPSDKGKWFMRKDGIQRILLGAKRVFVGNLEYGNNICSKNRQNRIFHYRGSGEDVKR